MKAVCVTFTARRDSCHVDVIIEQCRLRYLVAYNRHDPSAGPPKSTTVNHLDRFREEPADG